MQLSIQHQIGMKSDIHFRITPYKLSSSKEIKCPYNNKFWAELLKVLKNIFKCWCYEELSIKIIQQQHFKLLLHSWFLLLKVLNNYFLRGFKILVLSYEKTILEMILNKLSIKINGPSLPIITINRESYKCTECFGFHKRETMR